MVLIRILPLLALLGGCKQSLFANGSGDNAMDDQPDGGIPIPATCPATCLGDAGGDFGSATHPWRYVEDNRKHGWTPMPESGGIATGADSANTIASCATDSSAAACSALPGALLVSTSGANATADPAIELTIVASAVVKIDLAAVMPTGDTHSIILYRNSREDVLYTGTLAGGGTTTTSMTFDALAGDRILVAIAPTAMGAKDIGVQLFVSATGAMFPSDCELALEFAPITGTAVKNGCGADFTSRLYDETNGDSDLPLVEVPSPYPELGYAGSLKQNDYYASTGFLDRHGDSTTQLWLQWNGTADDEFAWFISDVDYDVGGGLGIDIGTPDFGTTYQLGAYTGDATTMVGVGITAGFTGDHAWHFVRVVYTSATSTLSMCMDGKFVKSMTGIQPLITAQSAYIGYNHDGSPVGAFVTGLVDDIRVIKTALPCE